MADRKSWMDDLMDKAENLVSGLEGAARRMEGVWKVGEIIEEDGKHLWNVSDDRSQKIHCYTEELAEKICELLNRP